MAQRTEAYIIRCQGVNLNSGFAGELHVWVALVTGSVLHFQFYSVEGPNKFTILMEADFDVTQLQVGFEGPSTPEVRLVTRKNKNVDVTFIPEVGGEYQIHIKYKGDHVFSSPFACKILGSVRSKLGKIICSGDTQRGRVGVKNFIVIDGRQLSVNGEENSHIELRSV